MRSGLLFLLVLFISSTAPAVDMDEGLYDPVPPNNSAFIRFVNFSQTKTFPAINGKQYGALEPNDITPYFVAKSGKTRLSMGKAEKRFKAILGNFYTVYLKNKIHVLEDDKNNNRAKSLILFYNLSEKNDLSLRTSNGSIEVIPNTTANNSSSVQINPVKIDLSVYDGEKNKIKDIGAVSLERGMAYSAIVIEGDVLWIRSTTDTAR